MIIDKRLKATDPKAPKAPVAPAKDDTAPKPAEPYANMFEVANDLLAYDRAGSWTEAMASLKIESAAQANACENQRKADKAGTTTSQATEATCTGSTTSPSEQSPPSPPPAPKPVHDKPPKAAKVEAK
jgi:hypothetical protein